MKRFLLFAGMCYYGNGGFADFIDAFDTREEAEAHLRTLPIDPSDSWAQIIDTQEWTQQEFEGRMILGVGSWDVAGEPYAIEPNQGETT